MNSFKQEFSVSMGSIWFGTVVKTSNGRHPIKKAHISINSP